MKLTGNTIFITGGGSGIGRALAESFHKLGNQVIISGRRGGHLADTIAANPGMASIELDIQDPKSVEATAQKLIAEYPKLNVLINNAGIMHFDDVTTRVDDEVLISTINTNLVGPIRMTGALVEHLKKQDNAAIVNVSSALAFVPLSPTAVYSSTKAALHSYSLSLRHRLKNTSVSVLEIAPPWVQTDLLNSNNEPRAMPLAEFIEETMEILATDSDEIVVERAAPLRANVGPGEHALVNQFNDTMVGAA